MSKDFLLEIGTEELPPKALPKLAQALANGIEQGLTDTKLSFKEIKWLAAPRRLAVMVTELQEQQDEQQIERRGPALQAAYDNDGNPSKALQGFAASCKVDIDKLQTIKTDKGEWLYYKALQKGAKTTELLADIVNTAIKKLPIPKPMRWGNYETEFIRPVHWVLMLFGKDIVEAQILGKQTDRYTQGHRFHFPDKIKIKQPSDYEEALKSKGKVIVDFAKRRAMIEQGIKENAEQVQGLAIYENDLIDEVTAIVEWPEPLLASFDADFLKVPQEALISAMQGHQKSFPIFNAEGELLPYFVFVANINSKQPEQVIKGNEKVMHARLSDAAFFYATDSKKHLDSHLDELKQIIFQKKLGTLFDRTLRIKKLASIIAGLLNADSALTERAAILAKCDLMTDMVFEFPELQGIMGRYYAQNDGEDKAVCRAIVEHYLPQGAGDNLPSDAVAISVALADKLDLISGIFAIGQKPTGDKDPFAVRRAAIGVVRILKEKQLALDLQDLIAAALTDLPSVNAETQNDIYAYIIERAKHYFADTGFDSDTFNAVNEITPKTLNDFAVRLQAVKTFTQLPAAANLAAANKRVKNILRKQDALNLSGNINQDLFEQDAEKALFAAIAKKQQQIEPLLTEKQYQQVLTALAELQQPVDDFFNDVMVMTEDKAVQKNRLLLLNQLRQLFLTVADISYLN